MNARLDSRTLMGATALSMPRAIRGGVRAEETPQQVIARVNAFCDSLKSRVGTLEASIDQLNSNAAGLLLGAGGGRAPTDPEYTGAFASWARRGEDEQRMRELNSAGQRASIQAAMSVGTDSAGGYLAPVEWDRTIINALRNISPMRRIATVVQTTVRGYSTLWSNKGWGSGWVGETAVRPETTTPAFSPIVFGHGEIYANPAVTQQLLDDADFPLEQWLAVELADEFTFQEGPAFIAGNGTNKPYGFLTYVTGAANAAVHPGGAILVGVTAASATLLAADDLLSLIYSLPAPYRQNAVWLMNSNTAGKIRTLKDGQGNYIWQTNTQAGEPSTLFGYTVEIDENMPNPAAGAIPIAFGDFKRGYVINDRMGVRILRDPYTAKPYVHFYATKRVGGGLKDPTAIKVLKMAAS